MRTTLVILFFIAFSSLNSQAQVVASVNSSTETINSTSENKPKSTNTDTVLSSAYPFKATTRRPQFPGGNEALQVFLTQELRYPEVAARNGIEGTVIVQAVVNPDGTLSQIKVRQSESQFLNSAAVSAIEKMPSWAPALQVGRAITCKVAIPVTFSLR